MSEDILTRVASAIAEAHLSDGPNDPLFDFYALTEEVADQYYAMARAAVGVLRGEFDKNKIAGPFFEDLFPEAWK